VKIVLNIHSEDGSSLEVHRINTLLAHGCCVISERGSDASLTEKVSGALDLCADHCALDQCALVVGYACLYAAAGMSASLLFSTYCLLSLRCIAC
jgi:hypothetical protein